MSDIIKEALTNNTRFKASIEKDIVFNTDIEGKRILNAEISKIYKHPTIINNDKDFQELIVKCYVVIEKMSKLKHNDWSYHELNDQLINGINFFLRGTKDDNQIVIDKNHCPKCGKTKKPWYSLCWECTEKEKQKPSCEICGIEVPEGHTLCKTHWLEKNEEKKKLKNIEYVKTKKEIEFKEKFEGKFYFNSQKVKSKSELLICYFLTANGINFSYEPLMTLNDKEIRPDFVIHDSKDNTIIIEHFGLETENYIEKKDMKEKEYRKLCADYPNFFFISTVEDDIYNLKDKLGKKLNETPLKKIIWK
jgi:hypothetical protein